MTVQIRKEYGLKYICKHKQRFNMKHEVGSIFYLYEM